MTGNRPWPRREEQRVRSTVRELIQLLSGLTVRLMNGNTDCHKLSNYFRLAPYTHCIL